MDGMKKFLPLLSCLLFVSLLTCVQAREIKVKWRGVMEMKDLAKARKTAEAEKKLLTILVANKTYDSETQGAQQAVDVIEDTIKALKGCSVIVRSSLNDVRGLKQGDEFNIEVIDGVQKAGNYLPMIIVMNSAEKKLVAVITPNDVIKEGSKAFRSVKKTARKLKKK